VAGQIFTICVALLAVAPRMPFDSNGTIGGKLSFPFRRALLLLVAVGVTRVLVCHIFFPGQIFLDNLLGIVHVVGQSFLCLTTAYILQLRLSQVINITPGASLMPVLVAIAVIAPLGAVLAHTAHPNFWSLVNIAKASSCYVVLQTLATYASVTTSGSHGRGSFLAQLVRMAEYWFLATSILAFVGEVLHGHILTRYQHLDGNNVEDEAHPIVVLLDAVRHNQDSGVDDWTRLLIHSIFLNSLDEMQHFTSNSSNSGSSGNSTGTRASGVPPTASDPEAMQSTAGMTLHPDGLGSIVPLVPRNHANTATLRSR